MKDDLRYFLNFNTVMFNRDLTFLCMIMTPRMTAIDLLLYHLNKLTIGLYWEMVVGLSFNNILSVQQYLLLLYFICAVKKEIPATLLRYDMVR